MIIKLLDWIFLFSFHLTVLYLKMGVWWHTGSGKSWDSTKHMQRALFWWHTGSGKSWNSIKHVEGVLSIGNIQEVWYSCAGTGNVCEAFVMTCRQAAGIKPIVWGEAEFGRLPANKRMHGIENAALFYVPAHDLPSSVIYHYHIFCFRHIPIHVMI